MKTLLSCSMIVVFLFVSVGFFIYAATSDVHAQQIRPPGDERKSPAEKKGGESPKRPLPDPGERKKPSPANPGKPGPDKPEGPIFIKESKAVEDGAPILVAEKSRDLNAREQTEAGRKEAVKDKFSPADNDTFKPAGAPKPTEPNTPTPRPGLGHGSYGQAK